MFNFILLFGSQFDILFPTIVNNNVLSISHRGRRGLDRMVVGFTTTCAISAYHH